MLLGFCQSFENGRPKMPREPISLHLVSGGDNFLALAILLPLEIVVFCVVKPLWNLSGIASLYDYYIVRGIAAPLYDIELWIIIAFSFLLFMGVYRCIKGPLPPSPPLRQPPTNSIFEELREKYRAARSCDFSEAEAAQKAKASAKAHLLLNNKNI